MFCIYKYIHDIHVSIEIILKYILVNILVSILGSRLHFTPTPKDSRSNYEKIYEDVFRPN